MSEKKQLTIAEMEQKREQWRAAIEVAPNEAKGKLLDRLKRIDWADVTTKDVRASNYLVESTGPEVFVIACPNKRCDAKWTYDLRKIAEELIGPLKNRTHVSGPGESLSQQDEWRTFTWGIVKPIAHKVHPVPGGQGAGGNFEIHLTINPAVEDEVLKLFMTYWETRKAADKKLRGPDLDADGLLQTFDTYVDMSDRP